MSKQNPLSDIKFLGPRSKNFVVPLEIVAQHTDLNIVIIIEA